MHEALSLRKNFSWAFTGNVLKAASTWVIVTMIVKIGSAAMAGKFILAGTIAAPIITITMLQLRAVQVTDARGEYSFADYLAARLLWTVVGIIALIVVSLGCYSGQTALVILLWGLVRSIESVADIIHGLFQRHERMNLSGISLMIKGPAFLILAAVLLLFTGQLVIAVIGIMVVHLLVLFLYDFPQAHQLLVYKSTVDGVPCRILLRFNIKRILALSWLSLPLGIVMFLVALQNSLPRLVLESHYGEVALGYIGPVGYPVLLGTLIITAMGQSAAPRLSNYYVTNLASYCRLLKKLVLLGLGLGLLFIAGVVLFGRLVLTILYTPDYGDYHTEFIIMACGGAAGFITSFCGVGLTAARIFRAQLFIAIAVCSVAVIIAFLLIPAYGIRGAAITFSASFFASVVGYSGILLYNIRKRQKQLKLSDVNGS